MKTLMTILAVTIIGLSGCVDGLAKKTEKLFEKFIVECENTGAEIITLEIHATSWGHGLSVSCTVPIENVETE